MDIHEQLQSDLKQAMRSGDKLRVEVIRSARAALQNAQIEAARQKYAAQARAIESRLADDAEARDAALAAIAADYHTPLVPADQVAVITKEIKRRRDAAEMYHKANQAERAAAEEAEARILEQYLPHQLTGDELRPQIADLIAELGLSSPADMGKLMPVVMERFQGRAEGRLLSQVAREVLTQVQQNN